MDMSGTWPNGLTANCPPSATTPSVQSIACPGAKQYQAHAETMPSCTAWFAMQGLVTRCHDAKANLPLPRFLSNSRACFGTNSRARTHIRILGQPRTFGPVGWSTTLSSSVSPRTGHFVLYDSSGCQDLVDGDSQSANVDLRGHTAAPMWTS